MTSIVSQPRKEGSAVIWNNRLRRSTLPHGQRCAHCPV